MIPEKCKAEFEKWYNHKYGSFGMQFFNPKSEEPEIITLRFCDFPFVYRQGVYVEYLASKGIEFEIQRSQVVAYEYSYAVIIFNKEDEIISDVIKAPDYNTALTEAIKKGFEPPRRRCM